LKSEPVLDGITEISRTFPSALLHVFAFAAERGGFGKTKRTGSLFSLPTPEVARINNLLLSGNCNRLLQVLLVLQNGLAELLYRTERSSHTTGQIED